MSKLSNNLTECQIRRLTKAVVNGNWIPKDIRKKLYFYAKTNLKICDGITETLLNGIHEYVDILGVKHDILKICFPGDEISLESYWEFMGDEPDSDYDENKFDEFNIHGYKNRILFLQYLIDKL